MYHLTFPSAHTHSRAKDNGILKVLAIYCEVCNVYTRICAKLAQRPGKGQWKYTIIKLSLSVRHYCKEGRAMMQLLLKINKGHGLKDDVES